MMSKILLILCFYLFGISLTSAQEQYTTQDTVKSSRPIKQDSLQFSSKAMIFAEENLEIIKTVTVKYVAPVAVETIKNDAIMTTIFQMTYELLPFAIKLVVSKEEFIRFGLKHRWKLIPVESNVITK